MPRCRFGSVLILIHGLPALGGRSTNLFELDVGRTGGDSAGSARTGHEELHDSGSRQLITRAIREQVLDEPLMCGDTQISKILKIKAPQDAAFDMEVVKNIRFSDALRSADRFIEQQRLEESRLAAELGDLESRCYQARLKAAEGKPDVPEGEITEALRKALLDSYKDLGVARDSDCNVIPTSPGAADPYDTSKTLFATTLQELLGRGRFNVIVRPKVKELCITVLGLSPETGAKTCDGLCDALAAKAESISEEVVAQVPSTDELRQQIQQKTAAIDGVKAAIKDCGATRDGIRTWSVQIEQISAQHDSHGKTQREIRGRLAEVTSSLEAYQLSVSSQTKLLEELLGLLHTSKEKEDNTKDSIDLNKREMERLTQATDETKTSLAELKEELTNSHSAVKAMQSFKAGLVLTMQSFVQLYDDAIRKPLRDSGITKAISDAHDSMFPNLELEKTWELSTSHVEALKRECIEVAAASSVTCSLAPVASSTNQTLNTAEQVGTLCGQGRKLQETCASQLEPADYVAGVQRAIEAKQSQVKQWIVGLRRELEDFSDPAGAGGINGEPEWLHRFAAVLPTTRFYQDFVAKWATPVEGADGDYGILYNMVKVLASVESQLDGKVIYATDKLNELNNEYVGSVKKDAELMAVLAAVEQELNDEEGRKIVLSTKLEELEAGMSTKEEQRLRLQKQLDALSVNFRDLEGNMKTIFQEFVGLAKTNFQASGDGTALLHETLRQMRLHTK